MMEKTMFWFTENRKKIGYTLGTLNVLGALTLFVNGQTTNGLIQLFAGSVLIFDAWTMK
jgi:hypothetical protein